jgi:hypothetical protein
MAWILELIKLGIDVTPYLLKLLEAVRTPGGPTDAQVAELTAMEAGLDEELANAQPSDL